MATSEGMGAYAARLATFQTPHQLSKRRASSQSKKKGGNTIEWPHERPGPEELARAGFFYRPAQESPDNVQCFACNVKLDGWESEDDALREHLAHSDSCPWATSLSVSRQDGQEEESRDPMCEELVAARQGTFEVGNGWVHEGKRGWRCKIAKMVDAGWTLDPSPDQEDGVTCFYCNLSLDGWEPKDDPSTEHKRRSPDCPFFALIERFRGNAAPKTKAKGRGRTSSSSKGSRLSTQSAMSTFSEVPSLADLGDSIATAEDSTLTTGTSASQSTVKAKRKGASTKGKGRKRANTVDDEDRDQTQSNELAHLQSELSAGPNQIEPTEKKPAMKKGGRKASQQVKQVDSSTVEASQAEAPPKKATRGRNPKAQTQSQAEPEPEPEPIIKNEPEGRWSEVSAQLQEELELSMEYEAPDHESTPQAAPAPKPKRGTKRTSEGVAKQDESMRIVSLEFPIPPSQVPAKAKRTRKPSKQIAAPESSEFEMHASVQEITTADRAIVGDDSAPASESEVVAGKKAVKGKKAAPRKGKGRKASSTRSSKVTVVASEPEGDEQEDLARDEMEIEAELARIAAEQQQEHQPLQDEQEKLEEFEPSPSHAQKHAQQIHELEQELQTEADALPVPSEGMANYVATVAASPLPNKTVALISKESTTPSPSGSDKENLPSSVAPLSARPAPIQSPTKTTRIPLAPGTPNRQSPTRNLAMSPSKHFSKLSTTTPWTAVDLDAVLLASPQPTPGTFNQRLASATGTLTSPEKGLTVEQWVRWRAEKTEEELRRKCEEMVGVLERGGVKALECLGGIEVVA